MAKKKTKKQKAPKFNPQIEHLETLIKYTERNIKNDDTELDKFFKYQANRLKEMVKAIK